MALITISEHEQIDRLRAHIERVIFGKGETVKLVITALLARGHVLIEDAPGVGKTALAHALARSLDGSFKRIQFTPDLLPSDISGLSVFSPETRGFTFSPGPVFANVVLADEINRATPRLQSALLEVMNERQVTVDGQSYPLPQPFMVIATQNPIEFLGTHPLPESQLDRFLMLLHLGYPTADDEFDIVVSRRGRDPIADMQPVLHVDDVNRLCAAASAVTMEESLTRYLVRLIQKTREEPLLSAGASPRGAIYLANAAQAYALVEGRDFVVPDDIKAVAPCVLSHRLIRRPGPLSPADYVAAREIVYRILNEVAVPE